MAGTKSDIPSTEDKRALLGAVATLKHNADWQRFLKAMRVDRESLVKRLIGAASVNEYGRGQVAGRAQQIDEILELSETAAETLRTFGTK